jgi:hypothetical protein
VILLAIFLDNQLGHLLTDIHSVTLRQLEDVLKGKFTFGIGVALVHSLNSLIRKWLASFMGLLAAQQINKGCSRDVRIGSSKSANNPIILSQGLPPGEEFRGGSDGGHWYFLGEFIIEEVNESG